jgi:hypothetical protein
VKTFSCLSVFAPGLRVRCSWIIYR